MNAFAVIIYRIVVLDLKVYLDGEQALTQIFYLKSFDMNSINVGKTEFVKNKMRAFLGLKPKTFTVNSGQKFRLIWVHIHLGFSLEFIAARQQH